MKRLLAAALALIAACVASTDPARAQETFRLGVTVTAKHPNGIFAGAFKEDLERRTGGRVKIDAIYGGALGGELELANQVKSGTLDMASISVPPIASISPAVQLSELPFFYANYDLARKVLDGEPGQSVLKLLEQQGVKGLAWGEIGFRGLLTTTKPINTIADLNGLKIRVVENRLYVSTWRALGANAVPMAWPEVYTALQQRTIDGVDTNYAAFIDAKDYEVAKNLAVLNHSYTANMLIMHAPKFQGLSAELKAAFEAAAKVGAAESRKAAKAVDDEAVEIMKKNGVAVTTPDRAAFRTQLQAVHDEFAGRVGLDIVKRASDLMAAR